MDGSFWDPVADLLALNHDVLTYDCRGHGSSDKPLGPYTIEMFVADLSELLHHLQWPLVSVAGASMGGSVALGFAATHADRVKSLGLIDTTAWYGEQATKNWTERADKAHQEGLQSLVGFQKTRWFTEQFAHNHPQVVDAAVAVFLKNDVMAFGQTCLMLGHFDLRSKLPQVKAKTLVVVGEEDYATPLAMAQVLQQGISGSTLEVLPQARHLTPLEHPERIASLLTSIT
jgi:3-oxoadipate enol-lactonase